MTGDVIWGLMIPFIGTAAGSAMVYLMRGQMRPARIFVRRTRRSSRLIKRRPMRR